MPATLGRRVRPDSPSGDPPVPDRSRDSTVRDTLLLLAALDVAVAANDWWPAPAVALALLMVLPGFLSLRALRFSIADMARSPGWIPASSIVVLTATALATNLIGPPLGLDQPLTTWPLALAVNLVCIALAVLPGRESPSAAATVAWRALDRRALWALLVPALAAAATLRLNNGFADPLPVVAAVLAVALIALSIRYAVNWSTQRLCWTLSSASLALILGYSMRSDYVFGWDISAEYSLIEATIAEGVWATAHPSDPYGAMLSLTALPALLHSMTGLSGLVLLKLVYPALFSLVPAIALVMLRSVLSARVALIGAALMLTQPSFISEMPALARQEIALVLCVSLLSAMIDTTLRRRQQLSLLAMLTAGVVVSHYSTTYALLTVVAGAMVVQLAVARLHGAPLVDARKLVVVAIALLGSVVWYQGITNSTGHALDTVNRLVESGLRILPSAEGESPLQAYLRGPDPPAPVTVDQYQSSIESDFARQRPWVVPVPGAADARWTLRPAADTQDEARWPALKAGAGLASLVFSQALVLVTIAGAAVLVLRRRVRGKLLDFAILSTSSIAVLGLARMSSAISVSYGQSRLYLQLMPIVAVPFLWALGTAWARLDGAALRVLGSGWQRVRHPLRAFLVFGVAAYLILLVCVAAGLVGAAAGYRSAANLFNSGEHYDRFYVTRPEVAAAQWLGRAQGPGSLTYADGHAQLRLYGYGTRTGAILTDIAPGTVDANAWVYASRVNTETGRAHAYYDAQLVTYVFPRGFLADQFGVAYSNGSTEVFH